MGFFSSSKTKDELFLVCDIGSASVGVGLVRILKQGETPEILDTVRLPIAFQQNLSFDKFLTEMVKTLGTAVSTIANKNRTLYGNPKHVKCFLSSPWYASQTRVVTLKKNTPFVFSEKLVNELVAKEIKLFEESEIKRYSSENNRARLIENKTIRVTLNGYKTTNPVGKKITELEATLFLSMSPEDVLAPIEKKIKHVFSGAQTDFYSLIFSSFVVVRDHFVHDGAFLLLNIGGEITDVSIIKNDILLESISFPLGRNFLIRRIASEFDKSIDEALSLIMMYEGGNMEKNSIPKFERVILAAKDEWLKSFQKSLVSISTDLSIPEDLFLTVDTDVANWFTQIIEREQFTQYMATDKKFNVIVMDEASMKPFMSQTSNTQTSDPFIMIESVFTKRIPK